MRRLALLALMLSCAPEVDARSPAPEAEEDAAERARIRGFLAGTREQGFPAPDLGADRDWLNVTRPLSSADLRGRVVILDFWTYCCINCMHVLPDLAYLEARFADAPFAVVGVHSAKFSNERDSEQIREAIRRYGIAHPVVNDAGFELWNAYGANAWPTFVVVGPDGTVLAALSGEGHRRTLEIIVEEALVMYADSGALASQPAPLPVRLEADTVRPGPLRYPGKVFATEALVVISDTGHNRVVVTDPSGAVQKVFGDGNPGLVDGPADTARFSSPQGVALLGTDVYVADTNNHALRKIDLASGLVSTVVGNGEQGHLRSGTWPASVARLASPWDLLAVDGDLLVANAGTHQIWRYDPDGAKVSAWSGSGREQQQDGPDGTSAWAQPSGLTTDGKSVFVADSESSSVRRVDLVTREVVSLAGGSPVAANLFDYGDVDGEGFEAKLQHPLGVAWDGRSVVVADSYNHKLKRLDPRSGTIITIGGGGAGFADGPLAEARFHEPGGLGYAGGRLYVADTNNHAIRVVDLARGTVSTLPVDAPVPMSAATSGSAAGFDLPLLPGARSVSVDPVSPGTTLRIDLELPKGRKLTEGAPSAWQLVGVDGVGGAIDKPSFTVTVPAVAGEAEVRALVFHCQANRDCRMDALTVSVPVESGASATRATVAVR